MYVETTFSLKKMRGGMVLLTHANKHILQMAISLNIHSALQM